MENVIMAQVTLNVGISDALVVICDVMDSLILHFITSMTMPSGQNKLNAGANTLVIEIGFFLGLGYGRQLE